MGLSNTTSKEGAPILHFFQCGEEMGKKQGKKPSKKETKSKCQRTFQLKQKVWDILVNPLETGPPETLTSVQ